MALNKSNLLIRDYGNIRHILRDIYIFGCFSRDDFVEMGISGRKYDNEQRRINAYLPQGFIRKRRVGRKVLQYCCPDWLNGPQNHLAETYRNKSFTLLDILSYFYVQQILYRHGVMTLPQLLARLPDASGEVCFTKDNLRVKLEELQEAGLILAEKEGRNVFYSVNRDLWEGFSDGELQDICDYLEFLENVLPIEMPFYFLRRKLKLYLSCERHRNTEEKRPFFFRQNHLFQLLDNGILLDILRAVRKRRYLTVRMYPGGNEFTVLPVRVVHDSIYGRQYLHCYDESVRRVRELRLDRLAEVRDGESAGQGRYEDAVLRCEAGRECWSISGVNNGLTQVEILFRSGAGKERVLLNRLRREGHGGKIEILEEGVYRYTILVRDPVEMVPWIRSFGEQAKVAGSGEYRIERRIAGNWRKALDKYEALP